MSISMLYNGVTIVADTPEEAAALIRALHTLVAVGNDWIEWSGGKCPVDPYSTVEVKLRDGGVIECAAGNFSWNHNNHPGDIVAYRVINA